MKKKPIKKPVKKKKNNTEPVVIVHQDGSFTTSLNKSGEHTGWISKEINLK